MDDGNVDMTQNVNDVVAAAHDPENPAAAAPGDDTKGDDGTTSSYVTAYALTLSLTLTLPLSNSIAYRYAVC